MSNRESSSYHSTPIRPSIGKYRVTNFLSILRSRESRLYSRKRSSSCQGPRPTLISSPRLSANPHSSAGAVRAVGFSLPSNTEALNHCVGRAECCLIEKISCISFAHRMIHSNPGVEVQSQLRRYIFAMAISRDASQRVATSHGDFTIRISAGRPAVSQPCILAGLSSTAISLVWHPFKTRILASGCIDGCVQVWDVENARSQDWQSQPKSMFPLGISPEPVACLDFHPEQDMLAIGIAHWVYLWDWSQQTPSFAFSTRNVTPPRSMGAPGPFSHKGKVSAHCFRWLQFHPDGRHLLVATTIGKSRVLSQCLARKAIVIPRSDLKFSTDMKCRKRAATFSEVDNPNPKRFSTLASTSDVPSVPTTNTISDEGFSRHVDFLRQSVHTLTGMVSSLVDIRNSVPGVRGHTSIVPSEAEAAIWRQSLVRVNRLALRFDSLLSLVLNAETRVRLSMIQDELRVISSAISRHTEEVATAELRNSDLVTAEVDLSTGGRRDGHAEWLVSDDVLLGGPVSPRSFTTGATIESSIDTVSHEGDHPMVPDVEEADPAPNDVTALPPTANSEEASTSRTTQIPQHFVQRMRMRSAMREIDRFNRFYGAVSSRLDELEGATSSAFVSGSTESVNDEAGPSNPPFVSRLVVPPLTERIGTPPPQQSSELPTVVQPSTSSVTPAHTTHPHTAGSSQFFSDIDRRIEASRRRILRLRRWLDEVRNSTEPSLSIASTANNTHRQSTGSGTEISPLRIGSTTEEDDDEGEIDEEDDEMEDLDRVAINFARPRQLYGMPLDGSSDYARYRSSGWSRTSIRLDYEKLVCTRRKCKTLSARRSHYRSGGAGLSYTTTTMPGTLEETEPCRIDCLSLENDLVTPLPLSSRTPLVPTCLISVRSNTSCVAVSHDGHRLACIAQLGCLGDRRPGGKGAGITDRSLCLYRLPDIPTSATFESETSEKGTTLIDMLNAAGCSAPVAKPASWRVSPILTRREMATVGVKSRVNWMEVIPTLGAQREEIPSPVNLSKQKSTAITTESLDSKKKSALFKGAAKLIFKRVLHPRESFLSMSPCSQYLAVAMDPHDSIYSIRPNGQLRQSNNGTVSLTLYDMSKNWWSLSCATPLVFNPVADPTSTLQDTIRTGISNSLITRPQKITCLRWPSDAACGPLFYGTSFGRVGSFVPTGRNFDDDLHAESVRRFRHKQMLRGGNSFDGDAASRGSNPSGQTTRRQRGIFAGVARPTNPAPTQIVYDTLAAHSSDSSDDDDDEEHFSNHASGGATFGVESGNYQMYSPDRAPPGGVRFLPVNLDPPVNLSPNQSQPRSSTTAPSSSMMVAPPMTPAQLAAERRIRASITELVRARDLRVGSIREAQSQADRLGLTGSNRSTYVTNSISTTLSPISQREDFSQVFNNYDPYGPSPSHTRDTSNDDENSET